MDLCSLYWFLVFYFLDFDSIIFIFDRVVLLLEISSKPSNCGGAGPLFRGVIGYSGQTGAYFLHYEVYFL